jgi:hypothetical protein
MKRRRLATLGVLILAGAVYACDEKLSDLTGPTPDLEPTFASVQSQVFSSTDAAGRAACITCHTDQGRAPSAGLVLREGAAFQSIVGVPSRNKPGETLVIPGNPDASYIVRKLEGGPDIVGERMPRTGGPYLTSGQMLVLRRWIQQGAKND